MGFVKGGKLGEVCVYTSEGVQVGEETWLMKSVRMNC